MRRLRNTATTLLVIAGLAAAPACEHQPGPDSVDPHADPGPATDGDEGRAWESARFPYTAADGRAQIFFTKPGTSSADAENPEVDDALFVLLSRAQHSVDLALFEYDSDPLVDGVLNALINQVSVRFVGDADELHDDGYEALQDLGVEMALRNPNDRIMHNKFAIIDQRWLVTGSMNFSRNGVLRNNNNVIVLDSPATAAYYQTEFNQMFEEAKFGRKKVKTEKEPLVVGGRVIETYFSPKDEISDVVRGLLADTHQSVHFLIFSFTHKDIRDDLISMSAAGVEVVGVFDESQGRGRYSVDEDLAAAGVPVFIDGNKNAIGFAGGKLHHKVMILDGGTPDAAVITGSYNWSNNATRYNDENMMVLRGPDLVAPYIEEFCRVLEVATPHPDLAQAPLDPCGKLLKQVRINEFMANPAGKDGPNEFVELVNTGAVAVNLSGWAIGDRSSPLRHVFDEVILQPAGAVVVWSGDKPGREGIVASSGRLSLTNSSDTITLRDNLDIIIDRVDYSAPRAGVSFNREVDGTAAEGFAHHDGLAPDSAPSSPGRQLDGARWPADTADRDVIINELLPNPGGTDLGREFVELVNIGSDIADLSGWTISDRSSVRHTFADDFLLLPDEAVVVFDRGDHSAIPGAINSSTGTLSLNNTSETVTLRHADGSEIDVAEWTSSPSGHSFNRDPDGMRDAPLALHRDVDGSLGNASPGIRANGNAFGAGGAPIVVINELLPNPDGTDLGQEYVEIVNVGGAAAQMGGWTLGDNTSPERHVFDDDAVLLPGEVVVVFDRGDHRHITGNVNSSSRTLSLNNSGDLVFLYDASGNVVDAVIYTDSDSGVALNRAQDGDRDVELVPHGDVPDAVGDMSPGRKANGSRW